MSATEPRAARQSGQWTAVQVLDDDATHPWLLKREGDWPSEFSRTAEVADWEPVQLSAGEVAGFVAFARQFGGQS